MLLLGVDNLFIYMLIVYSDSDNHSNEVWVVEWVL